MISCATERAIPPDEWPSLVATLLRLTQCVSRRVHAFLPTWERLSSVWCKSELLRGVLLRLVVRLTDRELAFTTACTTFSFCASLISAAVSGGLGTHAALRAATELPQSLSHLRHTGGLAARSSHITSTSFPGPFVLFLARYDQVTDPGSRLVHKCDESQIRESLDLIFKLRPHGKTPLWRVVLWVVRRG